MLITHDDARRAVREVRAYRDMPELDVLASYVDQQEERHDRKKKYYVGDEFVSRAGECRLIVNVAADRQTVQYSSGGVTKTVNMKSFVEWVNDRGAIRTEQAARPVGACG